MIIDQHHRGYRGYLEAGYRLTDIIEGNGADVMVWRRPCSYRRATDLVTITDLAGLPLVQLTAQGWTVALNKEAAPAVAACTAHDHPVAVTTIEAEERTWFEDHEHNDHAHRYTLYHITQGAHVETVCADSLPCVGDGSGCTSWSDDPCVCQNRRAVTIYGADPMDVRRHLDTLDDLARD